MRFSLSNIKFALRTLFSGRKHWDTIKSAAFANNFDWYYLYDMIYHKLIEMHDYFNNVDYASVDYKTISRDINICIHLLEIVTGEISIINIVHDKPDTVSLITDGKCNFHVECNRYVNCRNANRFIHCVFDYRENIKHNEKEFDMLDFYYKFPDELYLEKARRLLFKILSERSMFWWD